MFGLEGSGFVVCLGLVLFLIGLVMFYVRQRFHDQDAKLSQIISIIPVMTQQIQLHERELHPDMFHDMGGPGSLGTIPEEPQGKIDISQSEESDDDSTSDSDSESNTEEEPASEIKNIRLGSELPLKGITTIDDVGNELGSHLKSTVLSDDHGRKELPGVRVVTMTRDGTIGDDVGEHETDDKEASADVSSDTDNSDIVQHDPVPPSTLEEITIPLTHSAATDPVQDPATDYTKLSVVALRQIIGEKGLSTHTSKLKKNECLELLQ